MFKKRLDLMFELNEIKKIEDKNGNISDSNEIEAYIEKEKQKSIWEKAKDYFNLNLLKKLRKVYSGMPIYYRPIPF